MRKFCYSKNDYFTYYNMDTRLFDTIKLGVLDNVEWGHILVSLSNIDIINNIAQGEDQPNKINYEVVLPYQTQFKTAPEFMSANDSEQAVKELTLAYITLNGQERQLRDTASLKYIQITKEIRCLEKVIHYELIKNQ